MSSRIQPAMPPFPTAVQHRLDRLTPAGQQPLRLFTTLARDGRLFERFMSAGLLDKGHLTIRQREIVIDRTTALCGCEYEWGVHVAYFAAKAGLTDDQVAATVRADAADPCWTGSDALLIRFCDALHASCNVDDALWSELGAEFSAEAMLELLMLAGFYRMVSGIANALRLPNEPGTPKFPTD